MAALFEKPFVLSIGPQRAGADLVYHYYQTRDDVCLPFDAREIFFFDRHYLRGVEFYKSHFTPQKQHKIIAEITTTLFDFPEAPGRIYDIFGDDVTLICPLRDPVTRSYAVYKDYKEYGIVNGPIQSAVDEAPQILYASRYADHLQHWLDVFGRGKIQFLFYEDALNDPQNYYEKLCVMTGIAYKMPTKDITAPAEKAQNDQDILQWLSQRLNHEIEKLEDLLGGSIAAWK